MKSKRKNPKPCKGYNDKLGYGCNKPITIHTSGLCDNCLNHWKIDEIKKGNTSILSSITRKAKIEVNKVVKQKKKEITKEKKNKPLSTKFNIYNTTAWKWCKQFVLLSYADESGFVRCSTSPELIYHVTDRDLHTGHFIKVKDANSSNYSVAFDFRNLAPQSSRDNVFFNGKPEIMKKWLIQAHGEEEIENLIIKSKQHCKLTKYDLDEIAKNYRIRYKKLLKERNMTDPWK